MKAGFVNIFGKPNAGKSTLLNGLLGEKLAIVSSKVQTTRNRIKGFLTKPGEYQVIFSDTPGIIEPRYKLQEKMMQSVKSAVEDADVALLIADVNEPLESNNGLFASLRLKVPAIIVLNKIDKASKQKIAAAEKYFTEQPYCKALVKISALRQDSFTELINAILQWLPEGDAFYPDDDITDLSQRFFVGEFVREKIFELYGEEIPYHTAVLVNEFKEKEALTVIQADIIVVRESQKGILLGEGGKMIKKLGTDARVEIEKFLGRKVFLQLFIKVRPKWRDNELQLKEYGYH
ncbi:MAG TPA: GTPase Era [Panacibacter sp.]|nr:GTPase Era [Panacibacter sp.]HNP46909.1 GTPase Era [Panacibacter sp.]